MEIKEARPGPPLLLPSLVSSDLQQDSSRRLPDSPTEGQNPFLQSKCVLKISSSTKALEKSAHVYMFIKRGGMSSSNLSGSIVLTEKMQCDVLFSSLKQKKRRETD